MKATLIGNIGWHSLADGGFEFCSLWKAGHEYRLEGTAIRVEHDLWRLNYHVVLAEDWTTRHVALHWDHGAEHDSITLTRDDIDAWKVNGMEEPLLAGCKDVDFGFSPVTNLMPVRRLGKEHGDRVDVKAAWLRYPEMELQVAKQTYSRLGHRIIRYESSSGYKTDLEIDATGFVTNYPDLWRREEC